MRDILNALAFFCFCLGGAFLYAFVFDVEPLTAEKHYSLERDIFYHSDIGRESNFPSFDVWLAEQNDRDARFHEYLSNLASKVGHEYAEIWEPGICANSHWSPEEWAYDRGRD